MPFRVGATIPLAEAVVAAGMGRRAEGVEGVITELSETRGLRCSCVKLAIYPAWVKPYAGLAARQSILPNSTWCSQGCAGGFACVLPQPFQPPGADPHAGWCGRGAVYNGCPLSRLAAVALVNVCTMLKIDAQYWGAILRAGFLTPCFFAFVIDGAKPA